MNWKTLSSTDQLTSLIENSTESPVLIFKHSTRCSISSMALDRLERSWNEEETRPLEAFYLDLIENRDVSNLIASELGIEHQSPQVLIIVDKKVIYHNSHMGISYREILKEVDKLKVA